MLIINSLQFEESGLPESPLVPQGPAPITNAIINRIRFSIQKVYMSKEEAIEVEGVVTKVLSNAKFSVEIQNGHMVTAYPAGKMRKFFRIGL